MVARVALSNMRQGHEEPIRSFHARIKGQADTCKYEMKCTKAGCEQVNDFTEKILRDVVARGIADQEIQLDLLGEKNQDMSLKDVIEYIEAKESGKRSATRLLDPQDTDAVSSSCRRGKLQDVRAKAGTKPEKSRAAEKPKTKPQGACLYCGEVGHGKLYPHGAPDEPSALHMVKGVGGVAARITLSMLAWAAGGLLTRQLKRLMHGIFHEQTTVFAELCTVTAAGTKDDFRALPLAHHLYDDMCNKWVKCTSSPQPSSPLGDSTGTWWPHRGIWPGGGGGYSRRYDEIVTDIGNKTKCVDDTLLWSGHD